MKISALHVLFAVVAAAVIADGIEFLIGKLMPTWALGAGDVWKLVVVAALCALISCFIIRRLAIVIVILMCGILIQVFALIGHQESWAFFVSVSVAVAVLLPDFMDHEGHTVRS